MKNKPFLISLTCILLLFTACEDKKHAHSANEQTYTCPMHPQILSPDPGICPICKMDLVPLTDGGNEQEIHLSESQIRYANIKTLPLQSGNVALSKRLNGRILNNPESSGLISARYAGRIERLFVKESGIPVAKAQPLLQIFSEELLSLQQDYLLQIQQSEAFPNEEIYKKLMQAAENKLRLFGLTQAQIGAMKKSRKAAPRLTVIAPSAGTIQTILVTEGQYLSEGMEIMRYEDYSSLWVEADLYPNEMKDISLGTELLLENGQQSPETRVRINYISPQIDPLSRTIKVRGLLKNDGSYQAGMSVQLRLPSKSAQPVPLLPIDAVVRDGQGAHVWIKTGEGIFEPRQVHIADENTETVSITEGLEHDAELVVSGAYLLSSEYILKKGKHPAASGKEHKH